MTSRVLRKGEYLFRKGDKPDFFYGVLSGAISIRDETTHDAHERNKPHERFREYEKFVIRDGECFGEWGILYNQPRSASAVASEDTVLFSLDCISFSIVLSTSLYKVDSERRSFIIENFTICNNLELGHFNLLYKNIFPRVSFAILFDLILTIVLGLQ